jgi:heat shock protein 1/8
LHVSAQEKKSGNMQKITITNDLGRLTKDQIAKMVADAKANEEIDRMSKERVTAKNGLENYVYGVRNSLNGDKFKDTLSSSDRANVDKLVTDTQKWLDSNEHAEKHEYEAKQKEIEAVCMPLMQKAYQSGSAGAGAGAGAGSRGAGTGGSGHGGPTVDEVD